jgi:flagellar biosynthesis protein FlhG
VLLVDANPNSASLHTMLDMPFPDPPFEDGVVDIDEFRPVDTPIPGLRLLPQAYGIGTTTPLRPGRRARWAARLRRQPVDYVILDLGCGTTPPTLDLFLGADLGILVTNPDPPSVEGAYRFACALFMRRLRRALMKDRFRLRMLDRTLAGLLPLPMPQELVRGLARFDTNLAHLAAKELSTIRPRLIVNGARARADAELGHAMHDMAARYLGMHFDYSGHIERDDTVWLSVCRRRPLLIDSPTSKSARNIERIARRVLALVARKHEERPVEIPLVSPETTLYDALLTHRGAADDELRRAYRRQRDIYREGSLPLTSLVKHQDLPKAQALIDEAHDTLLDPLRRRAYDISTFPAEDEKPARQNPERDAALEAERAMLRDELAHELKAETLFTGPLLRKIRESQGVELADIAQRTKISATYLAAIEEERFAELPAFVYLRGFVSEVAKFLKLDALQVSRTYLKRYREWRTQHEHSETR